MSERKCSIPSGRRYPAKWWGPQFWRTMHIASFQYIANAQNKAAWRSFLTQWVPGALPCANCRAHYQKRLPKLNMEHILKSRSSLVTFLHSLHNEINAEVARKLGKPFKPLPFTSFCEFYRKHRSE